MVCFSLAMLVFTQQTEVSNGISKRLLPKVGDVGKRVPSGHNAEGISDPQSSTEASTDHG